MLFSTGVAEESSWFDVSLLSLLWDVTPKYITEVNFFFVNKKKNGCCYEEEYKDRDETRRCNVAWKKSDAKSTCCTIPFLWSAEPDTARPCRDKAPLCRYGSLSTQPAFQTLLCTRMCVSSVSKSGPTLTPMDCDPPGFPVHGVFQARTLEWGTLSTYRGSFQPRG